MLNLTLVDHGWWQDVTSAHNGLLHIKDGDDRARVCHLQVHLKKVPQVGNVLQPSVCGQCSKSTRQDAWLEMSSYAMYLPTYEAHVDVHQRDMRADMPVILHACLCLSHARQLLICWRS